MSERQILKADLVWTGEQFESDVLIEITPEGRIGEVGQLNEPPTREMRGCALMPGMINAHSHAFQRGLRGRGETFPDGAGNFWSWREEMYQLVESLDVEAMRDIARHAFREMRSAGITAVGEFHYFHHGPGGAASDNAFAMDEAILAAAREVGIRIVLLNAYYKTGGIGQQLAGGQKRFETTDLETYWQQMAQLERIIDPATQSLGVVAHSIRAVPIKDLIDLHGEAIRKHMPFHMHVEEQPQEIADCVHALGKPPLALLNEHLAICPHFTAVHCTHSAGADMEAFLGAGGRVCICPLTEANLGDGLADVPSILRHEGRICLGTDSNARISMLEEARWLEYGQRLARQARGITADAAGNVARPLCNMATIHGAASLGIKAGRIRPGYHADLLAINLNAPSLEGWSTATLLPALLLGAGDDAIATTCVGGRWSPSS